MAPKHQITIPYWLRLSQETRNKIAQIFNLNRSGGIQVHSAHGKTEVVSDGYNHKDLSKITPEAIAEYLKEPVSDSFWTAFERLVDTLEGRQAVEPQPVIEQEETKPRRGRPPKNPQP